MDIIAFARKLKDDNRSVLAKWGEKDLRIWLRDGFQCAYCGRDLLEEYETTYYDYSYDHLLPASAYRELECDEELNLVLSCWCCNKMKSTWDPNTWSRDGKVQDPMYVRESKPFTEETRSKLILRVKEGLEMYKAPDKARFPEEQALLKQFQRKGRAARAQ